MEDIPKKNPLCTYNPVLAGILPTGKSAAETKVLAEVRKQVGVERWNRGNSGNEKGGPTQLVRQALEAAGIIETDATGPLMDVKHVQTKDGTGTVHDKLWVTLGSDDDKLVLSQEIHEEFARRLLHKIDQCTFGQVITIKGFASAAERNGRTFYNHVASVKCNGEEVQAAPGLWDAAYASANAAAEALAGMGLTDPAVIKKAKASKINEFHLNLLAKISERFDAAIALAAEQAPVAAETPAAIDVVEPVVESAVVAAVPVVEAQPEAAPAAKAPLIDRLKARITGAKQVLADAASTAEQKTAANDEFNKLVEFGQEKLSPALFAELQAFAGVAQPDLQAAA